MTICLFVYCSFSFLILRLIDLLVWYEMECVSPCTKLKCQKIMAFVYPLRQWVFLGPCSPCVAFACLPLEISYKSFLFSMYTFSQTIAKFHYKVSMHVMKSVQFCCHCNFTMSWDKQSVGNLTTEHTAYTHTQFNRIAYSFVIFDGMHVFIRLFSFEHSKQRQRELESLCVCSFHSFFSRSIYLLVFLFLARSQPLARCHSLVALLSLKESNSKLLVQCRRFFY